MRTQRIPGICWRLVDLKGRKRRVKTTRKPSKDSADVETARVYVDPQYSPSFLIPQLDVLPFLVEQVIVYDPSKSNLRGWGYRYRRFSEFVDSGVFVPMSPGDKTLSEYQDRCQLVRDEVVDTQAFLAEYDRAIQEDLSDEGFLEIVKSLSKSGFMANPRDVAFSLNWDLILSSALRAPILCDEKHQLVWEYKMGLSPDVLQETIDASQMEKVKVLQKFLSKALGVLPLDLPVDYVVDFRKDSCARNFRLWFGKQISAAMRAEKVSEVETDTYLLEDFKELADTYSKKSKKWGAAATGATALAVTLVAGPLGGAASLGGQLVFPSIIRKLQKKYGRHNWVLVLVDMKKRLRQ